MQKIPQPSIIKIRLKITFLKFLSNLPGAIELSRSITGYGLKRFRCVDLETIQYQQQQQQQKQYYPIHRCCRPVCSSRAAVLGVPRNTAAFGRASSFAI